jgi:uncharacterized membrane protein
VSRLIRQNVSKEHISVDGENNLSWWQIALILPGSIIVGLLVGGLLSYLIARFPKGIKLGSGLIPLNLLAWVLILFIILFPSNVLRIILGIPLLLFFPGYALVGALFTKKEGMGSIERMALSLGLSIAVVPLIGLILNYTPWGIRLESILYSVVPFILVTSIIAWLRRSRLSEDERFTVVFRVTMPARGKGIRDMVLTITLVVALLGTTGALTYLITTPKAGEVFTEFYILDLEGKNMNYPGELKVGEETSVIVGIVNHEGKEVNYLVELVMDSKKSTDIGPMLLVDGQKWEGEVSFVPEAAGENQRVEFLLYEEGKVEPRLGPIYLWFDVSE